MTILTNYSKHLLQNHLTPIVDQLNRLNGYQKTALFAVAFFSTAGLGVVAPVATTAAFVFTTTLLICIVAASRLLRPQPAKVKKRVVIHCSDLIMNSNTGFSLPKDLALTIFRKAKSNLGPMSLVSKNWNKVSNDEVLYQSLYPSTVFGVKAYKEKLGVDAGEELRLPKWTYRLLESEEHIITFNPGIVSLTNNNGKKEEILFDSANSVIDLFKKHHKDFSNITTTMCYDTVVEQKREIERPHWTFTRVKFEYWNMTFSTQKAAVESKNRRVSTLIDTIIALLSIKNTPFEPYFYETGLPDQKYVRVDDTTICDSFNMFERHMR